MRPQTALWLVVLASLGMIAAGFLLFQNPDGGLISIGAGGLGGSLFAEMNRTLTNETSENAG